jgi:hypothetical protein
MREWIVYAPSASGTGRLPLTAARIKRARARRLQLMAAHIKRTAPAVCG